MIASVGIDLGRTGRHQVRVLDEGARPCDSFGFQHTLEGLETLERRIFLDGANPVIVFEPTGLAWLPVAIYLRARHPSCRLVRAKLQKVAALRRYLRGGAKSDRIDGLTLAKMPFVDAEQLDEVYLPPAELHALQRLTRQRERLERGVTARKNRIGSIVDGFLPGLREAFDDPWSRRARALLRQRLNPFAVVRSTAEELAAFLMEAESRPRGAKAEAFHVYRVCRQLVALYERCATAGVVNEEFFNDLQEEVACELRLMEAEEAEEERVAKRIADLYRRLHSEDHLRTIPGVGEHTAPVFLAMVGDPKRFRSQKAFANWSGVVPGARQSSSTEGKGLRMTKAGPAMMKRALYQAGNIGRRYDPQLAGVYYSQMVQHGKTHHQAMGAVMSHLSARVLSVLREGRPYQLRDVQGNPVTSAEALSLIRACYTVPQELRRQRRRRNPKPKRRRDTQQVVGNERETVSATIREAAIAPQRGASTVPRIVVYGVSPPDATSGRRRRKAPPS